MADTDGLGELYASADMSHFRSMMDGIEATQTVGRSIDPALYAACFATVAGKAVLQDMYSRYVNVTIVEPGQAPEVHGIRQGMANVVFDIVNQISEAYEGETNG
jgi:hypothetical protein